MLAALRVLHVDTSHTPANDAVIEERPHLETYQRDGKVYVRNQRVTLLKRDVGSNLVDVGRRAVHTRSPRWGGRVTPAPGEVAGREAMGKCCGVLVAMPQGQSWAPTPSIGVW
jgi:hypothetical protein